MTVALWGRTLPRGGMSARGGPTPTLRYFRQPLTATANPLVFIAPGTYVHGGLATECVYYNGQLLGEGALLDYIATESGGLGTGYDQITFTFLPAGHSNFFMDYSPG